MHVAVIGAGWAGCAAAVEAASAGHRVTLIEAGRELGGRARRVDINGSTLDNGQHILIGAYTESLRLMRTVGIDVEAAMLRLPLQMRYPDTATGMLFCAPRLPAPLHIAIALLRAKGLQSEDKLALARFSTTARWMGWELHNDCSVAELLERFDQTERLQRLLWRPLCIAALNTPAERASAKVFLAVLRDSLGACRAAASDMLLPRVDLSALFPDCAAQFLRQRGMAVRTGCRVIRIARNGAEWQLFVTGDESIEADAIVIATPLGEAARLLGDVWAGRGNLLPELAQEPIVTCYLQYDAGTALPHPFYALLDEPDAGRWGQFVFDRGQLNRAQAGLLSVVVSAAGRALELPQPQLSAKIASQLQQDFGLPALGMPRWSKVIAEKRATFSCTPGLERPGAELGIAGLALAGDYVASPYPGTLESAVRSGIAAALHAVASTPGRAAG